MEDQDEFLLFFTVVDYDMVVWYLIVNHDEGNFNLFMEPTTSSSIYSSFYESSLRYYEDYFYFIGSNVQMDEYLNTDQKVMFLAKQKYDASDKDSRWTNIQRGDYVDYDEAARDVYQYLLLYEVEVDWEVSSTGAFEEDSSVEEFNLLKVADNY
mmetsp:Transcript_33764/g.32830  ORF Transcript_33764/g.32830 Transcript_33764/m.32830 type:complete len:154 (+) Transcript_33764:404-865(+)